MIRKRSCAPGADRDLVVDAPSRPSRWISRSAGARSIRVSCSPSLLADARERVVITSQSLSCDVKRAPRWSQFTPCDFTTAVIATDCLPLIGNRRNTRDAVRAVDETMRFALRQRRTESRCRVSAINVSNRTVLNATTRSVHRYRSLEHRFFLRTSTTRWLDDA